MENEGQRWFGPTLMWSRMLSCQAGLPWWMLKAVEGAVKARGRGGRGGKGGESDIPWLAWKGDVSKIDPVRGLER